MNYTNPIDRFFFRIRGALVVVAVLSAPVFFLSYAMMLKWVLTTAPAWMGVAVIVSHVTVWIGLSALFDSLRERGQS